MWRSLIRILIVFVSAPFALAGMKTYCSYEDGDDSCDSEWTPFPNLASALVGYDLSKGDPFASGTLEDPGLRRRIFNATRDDEEYSEFVIETGISTREYRMCDPDFRSRAVTNMKNYEKVGYIDRSRGRTAIA